MKLLPQAWLMLFAAGFWWSDVRADLLANWRLDDPPGTTGAGSVLDSALGLHPGTPDPGVTFGGPGALPATATSASFAATRIGAAYNTALNPNAYTVSVWARTPTTTGTGAVISSRNGDGQATYILYKNGGRWQFWTGSGAGAWTTINGPLVSANTWTHLAATFDGTTMQFFVNGVSAGTTTVSTYVPNTNRPTYLGQGGNAGAEFAFDGDLDDVALFDRVLDTATLDQVRLNGAASVPSPMLLSLGKPYRYEGALPGFSGGTYYFDDPHVQTPGAYGFGDLTDGATYAGSPTATAISTLVGFDPASDATTITLDLQGVFQVSQVRLGTHRYAPFANGIPDDVTVSFATVDDPGSYFGSVTETFVNPGVDGHHDLIVPIDGASARYVRLTFDGGTPSGNKWMLDELSVYGVVPEPGTLGLLVAGAGALVCFRRRG